MTSEDERDPLGRVTESGRPIFVVKKKKGRSEKVTTSVRKLDALRELAYAYDPTRRTSERFREVPPDASMVDGIFTRLPKHFPIEGYNPEFYNKLPEAVRAKCSYPEMILPRNLDQLFTRTGDERLSAQELMNLNRKAVMKDYNYVSLEELGAAGDDEDMADYFEMTEDEGDEDDDEYLGRESEEERGMEGDEEDEEDSDDENEVHNSGRARVHKKRRVGSEAQMDED